MRGVSRIHPPEIYEKIMKHKELVDRKILTIASIGRKFNVPKNTICGWYHGRKPFFKIYLKQFGQRSKQLRKTVKKQIPELAKVLTPEKSYILGVLCGDGYVNYRDHYVSLETTTTEFIKKFQECCVKVYGYDFYGSIAPTRNGKQRIVICGKEMTEDIKKFLPEKGSFTWKIPKEISESNEDYKIGFLQGFFDSEGSVHKKFSIEFYSSNKEGLTQVKELLNSMNIKTSEIKAGKEKGLVLYITGKENIVTFINKIGANIPDRLKKMQELLLKYSTPDNSNF